LAFEEKSSYRFEFFAFRDKGVHFEEKKSNSQQPRDTEQVKLPTKNSAFCDG